MPQKLLRATLLAGVLLPAAFAGQPYQDTLYHGGAQRIPGAVFFAYYDQGGEGVAYHDTDANQGSGKLNPLNGTYLNEFRHLEALDISYTKQVPDLESPCNKVVPPLGLLYVGWNNPGDWFNLTVETAEAGAYVADLLYTAQRDATVSIEVNGRAPSTVALTSTFDAAETIPWRQWHHWNVIPDAVTLELSKGLRVLTVRIVTGGNCNLATLLFRPVGAARTGAAILTVKTPDPVTARAK